MKLAVLQIPGIGTVKEAAKLGAKMAIKKKYPWTISNFKEADLLQSLLLGAFI